MLSGGGTRTGRMRNWLLGSVAVPGAVGIANRLGLGPVRSELSVNAIGRAGFEAMSDVCRVLHIEADHLIFGCAPESPFGPGLIDTVLRRLGVRDECDFVRMDDPIYVGQFPGVRVAVPHGREAYLDAHLREFPGQRTGLQRLVEL